MILRRLAQSLAGLALVVLPALFAGGCSSSSGETVCGGEADTAVCGRLGYECGSVTVCYVCGVSKRVDCGACAETQTCGGGGTPNVCWPPLADAAAEGGDDAVDAGLDANANDASDDAGSSDVSVDSSVEASSDASVDSSADSSVDSSVDSSADATISDGSVDATLGAGPDTDGSVTDPGTFVLCSDDAVPPDAVSE